jgi:ABC-type sugar transport system ATPase subunit
MANIVKVNSPTVVTCMGLTKIYQTGVVALNDLTLTIEPGMSFGLMGENGAGKSTPVKLLMGFIFPTKGNSALNLGFKSLLLKHRTITCALASNLKIEYWQHLLTQIFRYTRLIQ